MYRSQLPRAKGGRSGNLVTQISRRSICGAKSSGSTGNHFRDILYKQLNLEIYFCILDMEHTLNKFQNLGPCWSTRYHSTNKRGEDGIQYVHLFCDVIESSWPNGYFNWHHCLKQCCYRNHWSRANTRITFGRQLTMNMISIRFIWFNICSIYMIQPSIWFIRLRRLSHSLPLTR